MKTVFDHPVVVEGDVAQLRSFYNTLHNAVATMKSLGYSHDYLKLPDPLKEKWGERKIEMQPAIPSLVDLDEWLRVRLRAKTTVCEPLPSFSKPSRGERSRFRRPSRKGEQHSDSSREQPHRFSTSATGAMTGKQTTPTSKTCLVCDNEHPIEKSEKFLAMNVNGSATRHRKEVVLFLF